VQLIRPLKIGSVTLKNNLILAPLAGYSDIAFRRLCRELGAGLTITEMVSVRGLLYESSKTRDLMTLADCESPSSLQLFGSNHNDFKEAANRGLIDGFDLIDINMGCPMPKITKNGDGSALLDNVENATKIVEALVACGKTVTVKVRLGKKDKANAINFCKAIEHAGASLITVHGRTAKQLYSGTADWEAIGEVANALKIPVVGNGDILTQQDILDKLATYPVAGVMIGRGAIARPNIFSQCTMHNAQCTMNDKLLNEEQGIAVGNKDNNCALCIVHCALKNVHCALKEIILKHIDYTLENFNENFTVHKLRKHFAYYFRGVPNIKDLKMFLMRCDSVVEMRRAIEGAQF